MEIGKRKIGKWKMKMDTGKRKMEKGKKWKMEMENRERRIENGEWENNM